MSTYLVTGGAGFIGSNLVDRLVTEGHQVRVLDDLTSGNLANLAHLEGRCDVRIGSITDRAAVAASMEGVDYVLHQAAVVSVVFSVEHPRQTRAVNVDGTALVLDEARRAGVRRVVLASSCAVYGDPDEFPVHEGIEPSPRSPYAETKLATEDLVARCTAGDGPEAVALRYFNIYGPRQDPASQYAAVVPLFMQAFSGRTPVTLFGDGHQTRDFCFVGDVVRANLAACVAPGAAGRAYNVGTGVETSLWDLLGALEQAFGHGVEVRHEPDRAGDLRRSVARVAEASDRLSFDAQVSLTDGLATTVQWYMEEGPGRK